VSNVDRFYTMPASELKMNKGKAVEEFAKLPQADLAQKLVNVLIDYRDGQDRTTKIRAAAEALKTALNG
jgi:hypothetical protein